MNFKDYLRESLNEAEVSPELPNQYSPVFLPPDTYKHIEKYAPEIQQFYNRPFPDEEMVPDESPYWEEWGEPQEYDWNNDGTPDLVYISPDGRIVIIDKETGEILWQSHPTPQVLRQFNRRYPLLIDPDSPLDDYPPLYTEPYDLYK